MVERIIPQRELRNSIGEVLREAEAGTEFTITVRGRPVAKLGARNDAERRRVNVPADALRAKLADTPVDAEFATVTTRGGTESRSVFPSHRRRHVEVGDEVGPQCGDQLASVVPLHPSHRDAVNWWHDKSYASHPPESQVDEP